MNRLTSNLFRHGLEATTRTTNGSKQRCKAFFLQSCQKHTLSLQLDYYMSPQFAGIACAVTNQLYEKNGIDLKFLPICPVGLELQRVRDNATANGASSVTVGSVEQNIFIPTLYRDPSLKVLGIAAMFRRSPLCLASLVSSTKKAATVVGAHEDTVSLLQRILDGDDVSVVASPRATKNTDLIEGKLDKIQTYLTTEVPTLERKLGNDAVIAEPLEGMSGAKLGYSQMLFAPEEDLESPDKREVVEAFLESTFRGWEIAIRDNVSAAKCVEEAKSILKLDDENNDHWDTSFDYTVQNVGLCCDFVKETFQGDRYGVINEERWNEATNWLLADKEGAVSSNFGLDNKVWQPSQKLLAGNELARTILEGAKKSAEEFYSVKGRKPSVAILTVGELSRYTHGPRRIEIYSNNENSWFNKTSVGQANGFDVKEISLSESTSTDELLSEIYALKDYDGIQLMWPLPSQIDQWKVYDAIDVNQDVDGVYYVGQLELDPKSSPVPAVTPAAVISLIDEYEIVLENKVVLVVGRSRIVGSPLTYMLRNRGAIVTVAHSDVKAEKLQSLVSTSDVVISCAGSPGLLNTEWLKPGTDVINVGTTFIEEDDALRSDFHGDISKVDRCRYSPVPGGIGPLSVAQLFHNVANVAWDKRNQEKANVDATWTKHTESLRRSIHFKDYDSALVFANKVNDTISSKLDHHPNMTITHKCVDGVNVELEYFTFEANKITDKDYEAASAVDALLNDGKGE